MGAGQSSGSDVGGSTMGYQVLRVYPNSPGSRAGLKAYFDFIVAIGNTRFNQENGSLREILKASIDQKLKMVVFNTRTKKIRETEIVPSTSWGGNGLLGVSIKHSSFDRADERVWHVVEVEPGSPAQQAGFQTNDDYVIGSDSILQENDDLYNLVEAHEGKALKLFVYNTKTDNCREVICHPNSRWGGKGLLGCEFGHGLLHRIPYAGGDEGIDENPRASLLRNEQKISETSQPVLNANNPNQFIQSPMMQQFQQGPGHQLLQQALSDRPPQQQQPVSVDKILPTPPPVPQTFAQLAAAQFQSQQHQSPQQPPSPQTNPFTTDHLQATGSTTVAPQQTLPHNQAQPGPWPQSYQSQQPPVFQQQMQALQQPDTNQIQQQPTSVEKTMPSLPPMSQSFAHFASNQQQYQPPPTNPASQMSPPNASYTQDMSSTNSAPQQTLQLNQQAPPEMKPWAQFDPSQNPYLFQQQIQTLQQPSPNQEQQHLQQNQSQVQQPPPEFPFIQQSIDSNQ